MKWLSGTSNRGRFIRCHKNFNQRSPDAFERQRQITISTYLRVWKNAKTIIIFFLEHTQVMQNDEGQLGQSIHHIVYCSRAVLDMDKETLDKIISTSKKNNPRFGITGLLVFGSGIFFQWLEGPKDNVTSLYKIISADPRHSDVVLLTKEDEFRERLFPNWDMELVAAEDISAVLEDAMHEASDSKQKNTLSNMLLELNKSPLGRHDNSL